MLLTSACKQELFISRANDLPYLFCIKVMIRVCSFYVLYINLLKRGYDMGSKVWMQIDRANLTDWIFFLPSNLMEEISRNPESLNANT